MSAIPEQTRDLEMEALGDVARALAPLDRGAAKRVLDWANKRYVEVETPMSHESMDALNKFLEAIHKTAQRLHIARPADLLTAMALVAEKTDEVQREAEQA